MQFPQLTSRDGKVSLKVGPRRATLSIDGNRVAGFDVIYEPRLALGRAHELASLEPGPWLVACGESSPQARAALREDGISYASETGEMYIHAPPVHVEVPGRDRGGAAAMGSRPAPFALRGSRIPRWLLLHPNVTPSFSDLAQAVELSDSNVSRTVHALADEALVRVERDPIDGRSRRVRVDHPAALLEALEETWRRRRFSSLTLDVGARGVQQAEGIVRRTAKQAGRRYAVGGLAGADKLVKGAQPASVAVWIVAADADIWAEELGDYQSFAQPGSVTLSVAPDPFVLSMASTFNGLWVADQVQLYLDCRRSGERALEAAEAIRAEMGW